MVGKLNQQHWPGNEVGPGHTEDTAYFRCAGSSRVARMISQEDAPALWIIHIDTSSGKVLASK